MKYDALQGDFSFGEISPSAQGDVEGIIYKAAAARIINMVPTRTKGVASRAGGKWVADGFNATTLVADNSPVQHIPLANSPIGDIVIEIGRNGMRLMDAFGPLDWSVYQKDSLFNYTTQDGTNAWGDSNTRTIYLSNVSGVGKKQYGVTGPDAAVDGLIINFPLVGFPAGTNEHWTFAGKIAGDLITVEIRDSSFTLISSTTIDGRNGVFSYDFHPLSGGVPDDFSITLVTINNAVSTTAVWDLVLFKNGTKFSQGLNAAQLDVQPPDVNRIRAAAFWTSKDYPINDPGGLFTSSLPKFWVAFAGGPRNKWASWCLTLEVSSTGHGQWQFGTLPTDADSLDMIKGSNCVAVYQNRLTFGNNKAAGRPQVVASSSGFLDVYDNELVAGYNYPGPANPLVRFTFKKFKYTYTVVGAVGGVSPPNPPPNPPGVGVRGGLTGQEYQRFVTNQPNNFGTIIGIVRGVRVNIPGVSIDALTPEMPSVADIPIGGDVNGAPFISVKLNGTPVKVTPVPPGFASQKLPATPFGDGIKADAGLECWVEYPNAWGVFSPWSCTVWFNDDPSTMSNLVGPVPLAIGATLEFSTQPLASDPLNLTLASPIGNISFLNVLRGLILGSTTAEKLFPPDTPFALDPATGSSIVAEDESEQGSDDALNAINVNDKVLFVQLGRKTLRQAYISFATQGGLAAEDIGQMGEHLTGKGIRSFCLLKTPVQRVVFAFDDGSGAIMTLNANNTQAWSQFTLPAVFGGIYSVAALQTKTGSQLFVGTENGTTLVWTSFESKINNGVTPTLVISQAVPLPPVKIVYDTENAVPPIMDGWFRAAINDDTGTQALQLPNSFVGQNMYALVNGNLVGPYPVIANSGADGSNAITFPAGLGLTTTWVDPSGKKRPQETYVGILYPAHGMTTLGLEGGNPAGTSQGKVSRKAQLYVRFVDSYLPKVNGERPEEIQPGDRMDFLASRVTGDVRCTELEFQRAAVIVVDQDLPLRVEISAFFGGTAMNGV